LQKKKRRPEKKGGKARPALLHFIAHVEKEKREERRGGKLQEGKKKGGKSWLAKPDNYRLVVC